MFDVSLFSSLVPVAILPQLAALTALVMALTSMVKNVVDSRWSPLFSLVLGVLGVWLVGVSFVSAILPGLVVGVLAAGLYSGGKSLAGY